MQYINILGSLYHLLIHVDNVVDEKEKSLVSQIVSVEGFSIHEFNQHLLNIEETDKKSLYDITISALKNKSQNMQIRCIAWLCVIANADGFMDNREWEFIYKIYHHELKLSQEKILQEQKNLKNKIK